MYSFIVIPLSHLSLLAKIYYLIVDHYATVVTILIVEAAV